jgi:hypothetical protein
MYLALRAIAGSPDAQRVRFGGFSQDNEATFEPHAKSRDKDVETGRHRASLAHAHLLRSSRI